MSDWQKIELTLYAEGEGCTFKQTKNPITTIMGAFASTFGVVGHARALEGEFDGIYLKVTLFPKMEFYREDVNDVNSICLEKESTTPEQKKALVEWVTIIKPTPSSKWEGRVLMPRGETTFGDGTVLIRNTNVTYTKKRSVDVEQPSL